MVAARQCRGAASIGRAGTPASGSDAPPSVTDPAQGGSFLAERSWLTSAPNVPVVAGFSGLCARPRKGDPPIMSRFITYLALERPGAVTPDRLAEMFRDLYPGDGFVCRPAVADAAGLPEDGLLMSVDDHLVAVMIVPAPLPPDAYERELAIDRVWPEARQVMAAHRAHAIVALIKNATDPLSALNGAAAVTLIAGALSRLVPTVALVFTEGKALAPGETLVPLCQGLARLDVPVELWTSLEFVRAPNTADGRPQSSLILSNGLLPFVGRELEFLPTPAPLVEAVKRVLGLMQYLIREGPVINDGDTVGVSRAERIHVAFADRGHRPGVPVMRCTVEHFAPAASPVVSDPPP